MGSSLPGLLTRPARSILGETGCNQKLLGARSSSMLGKGEGSIPWAVNSTECSPNEYPWVLAYLDGGEFGAKYSST